MQHWKSIQTGKLYLPYDSHIMIILLYAGSKDTPTTTPKGASAASQAEVEALVPVWLEGNTSVLVENQAAPVFHVDFIESNDWSSANMTFLVQAFQISVVYKAFGDPCFDYTSWTRPEDVDKEDSR